jgi:hypothetical protein
MWSYLARSTLKREFASTLMLWLLAMSTYLIIIAPTWDQAYRLLGDYVLPIMGIATAAFGADFVAKQTNIGGPPQGGDGPPRDCDHHDGDNPANGNGNP